MITRSDSQTLEKRFRALLPHMIMTQVDALLQTVQHLEMDSMEEPQTGLVMLTAKDAFQEPFHLGEVLVSTMEVTFDGLRGHATVMGDDTRKALLSAMINAVSRHPNRDDLLSGFQNELDAVSLTVEAALAQEASLVAATRVNFDSMAPEEM